MTAQSADSEKRSSRKGPSQAGENDDAPALFAQRAEGGWLAQNWQKILALVVWGILIGSYIVYTRANQLGPLASLQEIIVLMQGTVWGPLIYIALYAARPLIFFSATLLTLAGGFIFGPILGVLYTIVASNTSAMVAYGMGRYFGEGFLDVDRLGGIVRNYAGRMRRNSFETVLIMRFIFLPYDLVSYLAGLLRVDWRGFLLATAVGCLPGTVAFVLAGASFDGNFDGGAPSLNPWVLALSAAVFISSLVLSRYFKRREAQVMETAAPAGEAQTERQHP